MPTMINSLLSMAHRITSSIFFRNSSFETCLFYDRRDGKRVDFVVVHVMQDRDMMLHLTAMKPTSNNPSEHITLSMEEARLLRDFLNRPEVGAWIDENEA